jgi:hypothetical protein
VGMGSILGSVSAHIVVIPQHHSAQPWVSSRGYGGIRMRDNGSRPLPIFFGDIFSPLVTTSHLDSYQPIKLQVGLRSARPNKYQSRLEYKNLRKAIMNKSRLLGAICGCLLVLISAENDAAPVFIGGTPILATIV